MSVAFFGTGGEKEKFEGDLFTKGELNITDKRKAAPKEEKKPFQFSGTVINPENSEEFSFQTETRKILDIVTNSIYTDKEIFLRELISNASDALEAARCHLNSGTLKNPEIPLQIEIYTNEKEKTLTIIDTGVGMTEEDMKKNLGTIARSGTKDLLASLNMTKEDSNFIGQFGVGFYSSFMVSNMVDVYSKSGTVEIEPHVWMSDGSGKYKINKANNVQRGTTIVLHLKDTESQYCSNSNVMKLIKKYSNFLNYPIKLDGQLVNTIKALWTMDPKTITENQYSEFYKFIANTWDSPMLKFHYKADIPLQIKSLFFVGSTQTEKLGMGRMEPGISLYSQRVLIQAKCQKLLPEWMRFVSGVVDCDDIPLSISREGGQDSLLMEKLKQNITRRVIKFFDNELKTNRPNYIKFYKEYVSFLREGLCTDATYKQELSNIMLYDSSIDSQMLTLDEYCKNRAEGDIFYLFSADKTAALNSPYYEAYKKKHIPVLFVYNPLDDYAFTTLGTFQNRKLVSCEQHNIDISKEETSATDTEKKTGDSVEEEKKSDAISMNKEEIDSFVSWCKTSLKDKAKDIKISNRLVNSPALILNESGSTMMRMMKIMEDTQQGIKTIPREVMEINLSHPTILALNEKRKNNEETAKLIAEQIYDNCLMDAGLLTEPRLMLNRINSMIDILLTK